MSFSNMLEILQEKNKGKIVLIKLGAFYVATEKDAVLLHNKLELKCTCFKNNICKVGIPINSLERYIEKLDKIKYSYIIYDYNKEKNELKEIYSKIGKQNKVTDKNIKCLKCKGIVAYKNDEYMEAIYKLESKQLTLIPKIEDYIEYVLNIITKLPRTEKFSIGNEYKKSMYEILENSLYMAKVNNSEDKKEILKTLNYIDSKLTCQRIYLRIMKKQKWIDENKFNISINKIYEIGKIVGGLIKYYAKNY